MPHPRGDDLPWPSRRTILLVVRRILVSAWAAYAAVTIALLITGEPVLPAQISATLQLGLFAGVWACSYALESMAAADWRQQVVDELTVLGRGLASVEACREQTQPLPRLRVASAVVATAVVPAPPAIDPDVIDLARRVAKRVE